MVKLVILLFTCTLLWQCNRVDNKPQYVFRASILTNENHTWFRAFAYMSELLWERTDGRVKMEVYHSEQLAKEMEAIRLIETEVIDMTIIGSTLTNWVEVAAFCGMPYLLDNAEQQELLVNGMLGKRVEEGIRAATNLMPIACFMRTPRHLTSNRPIRHPDDLRGLIIRVPSVPLFVTAWSAMGAKPTPMAFSEVFTSLQQGAIEGLENPVDIILNGGFYEVQKYVNLTGHVRSWAYAAVGEKQFEKLPPDLQEIFLEVAREMEKYEASIRKKAQEKIEQTLRDRGMEFIEVDRSAFSEKCKLAVIESLSPEMQQLFREAEALKKTIKKNENLHHKDL
ncbi:MAG: TRAP transporter substrate-binding protein [Saprospiraceae bacterium]|nr:TRAP transporter substrate-binding protein [Saprospiraceae bacterium]